MISGEAWESNSCGVGMMHLRWRNPAESALTLFYPFFNISFEKFV